MPPLLSLPGRLGQQPHSPQTQACTHMHGRGRAAGLRRAADKGMYMRMRAARWADVGGMFGTDDLNHAAPRGALVRLHVHTVC